MTENKSIKVLIAKPGLDGHNRGARILTLGLRGEGMDVIYTGLRKTPEEIIDRAIREKVNVIGLSILSGAHKTLLPKICEVAHKSGLEKVLIIAGGSIPSEDIPFLIEKGISAVFTAGTSIKQVADYIRQNVKL